MHTIISLLGHLHGIVVAILAVLLWAVGKVIAQPTEHTSGIADAAHLGSAKVTSWAKAQLAKADKALAEASKASKEAALKAAEEAAKASTTN